MPKRIGRLCVIERYLKVSAGRSFKSNKKRLQGYLRKHGVKLPPLYKHYADVCDEQGVSFVDFSIDPDFLLLH